ncbi:hypothetical protein QBC38DRAFT_184523 [Podospora fimiseda]|uniref:Uncharacterized protein n=1 Tax=Podospora fimiseda TaxID=252190 RepID=A0AAN7BQI6_9PEZI|nr:hypothetical protein QBC38DRAFT_184523 [Podospora fimiseda]
MSGNPYDHAASTSRRRVRFATPEATQQPPPLAAPHPVVNMAGVHFDPPTASTQNGPRVHVYNPNSDITPAAALGNAHQAASYAQPCQGHYQNGGTAQYQPQYASTSQHHPQYTAATQHQGHYIPPIQPQQQYTAPAQPHYYQPHHQPQPVQAQIIPDPALGIGLTESQTLASTIRKAQQEGASIPGEIKPANDDEFKKCWVQEVNGVMTLMDKRVIDRMGNVKWVLGTRGEFIAVRGDRGPRV